MKKKFPFLLVLLLSFAVLTGFNTPSKSDVGYEVVANPKFKNLKVFPKDISEEALKGAMRSFNKALGVKCNHCHVKAGEDDLDFVSDANPNKDVARGMMRMTMKINKKYFETSNPAEFSVNCMTCHNGQQKPSTGEGH